MRTNATLADKLTHLDPCLMAFLADNLEMANELAARIRIVCESQDSWRTSREAVNYAAEEREYAAIGQLLERALNRRGLECLDVDASHVKVWGKPHAGPGARRGRTTRWRAR